MLETRSSIGYCRTKNSPTNLSDMAGGIKVLIKTSDSFYNEDKAYREASMENPVHEGLGMFLFILSLVIFFGLSLYLVLS